MTVASAASLPAVRLLIDSLRTLGGVLARSPFLVFSSEPQPVHLLPDANTHLLPLEVPSLLSAYPFGEKVVACAQAEKLVPAGTRALVWMDPQCLVVQPPLLFNLEAGCAAAFRPVHIRNVGLPPSTPLDPFWKGICAACGIEDIPTTVESFVDAQRLRTYFNTHAFAVDPSWGILGRWYNIFQRLVTDEGFQSAACADEPHQIFLFQAVLSALVVAQIDPVSLRFLPNTYNYPLHLHKDIPVERRLAALDQAVCFTYEQLSIHPAAVTGIQIRQPLRTWLEDRTTIK